MDMDLAAFDDLMLTILLPGLILFMGFIIWDLAKNSNAGKFGTMVLFGVLGLGVLGFVIKKLVAMSLGL